MLRPRVILDRPLLRWLLVAAFVMVTVFPAGARVLCIAADGHIGVELPHDSGRCDNAAPIPDAATAAPHAVGVLTANACTDLPAGWIAAAPTSTSRERGAHTLAACPSLPAAQVFAGDPVRPQAAPPPRSPGYELGSLSALRSTRLLI